MEASYPSMDSTTCRTITHCDIACLGKDRHMIGLRTHAHNAHGAYECLWKTLAEILALKHREFRGNRNLMMFCSDV